jgi:16S rRNA (guanine527-N7)-methyltransferase
MFHVEQSLLSRISGFLDTEFTEDQVERLDRYRFWLKSEALPAGGIGPSEADRIEERHIADSLLFSRFAVPTAVAWDLGSGVGLPGIPLAVILPETKWVLIDRSGKRVELMRRAQRVLELDNVEVKQDSIDTLSGQVKFIVSRATLPPSELAKVVERHLDTGGVAVTGGSWTSAPSHKEWETVEIPPKVLDRPIWFLMMRHP